MILEVLIPIVMSSNDLRKDTEVKMSLTHSSNMMLNVLTNINTGAEQSNCCLYTPGHKIQ